MQYAMQEMQKQVEEKKKTVETIQKEIQDCEAKIVELKEAVNCNFKLNTYCKKIKLHAH